MIEVSSDIKFAALHEHYNDTFENIKESIKFRDKLTALILLVLIFMALYVFWPTDAISAFSQISVQKLGFVVNIDKSFLGSIIWFILLVTIVRYTQVVVYIERQYAYIQRIEKELQNHYDDEIVFTREGESYLKKYPKFSDWVWILYMILFPCILVVVVLVKIINEWIVTSSVLFLPIILNTIIAICILISIALYMLFMHKQKQLRDS